jgi:predicted nucleic acid-binding protein
VSVLVDTSVWIDHFRHADRELQSRLERGQVWTHAVVIGELAAGQLRERAAVLRHLLRLPRADDIDLEEGLHLVEAHDLAGRGLSWSDVQLLAAAKIGGVRLWTRDRALAQAAQHLGLGFEAT